MVSVVAEEFRQFLLGSSLDPPKELPARLAVAHDAGRLSEGFEWSEGEDSLLSCTVPAEKDKPRRLVECLESLGGSKGVVVGDLDVLVTLDFRLTDSKRPDDAPSVFDAISGQEVAGVGLEVTMMEDGELGRVVGGQGRGDVRREIGSSQHRDVSDVRMG